MGINTTSQIFTPRNMIEGLTPANVNVDRADDLTQSIVNAAGIHTYTLAHTATNSIMNIYSTDLTEYLDWDNGSVAGTKTTTLILDMGKRVFVHNTIINFIISRSGSSGTAADSSFTTSYGTDAVNWTQIDTTTISGTSAPVTTTADHTLKKKRYRYIKFVYYSNTAGSVTQNLKLNRVGLFR